MHNNWYGKWWLVCNVEVDADSLEEAHEKVFAGKGKVVAVMIEIPNKKTKSLKSVN